MAVSDQRPVVTKQLGTESNEGDFFRFARTDKREVESFVQQLIQYVKVRGPFDGVVGFSEGGAAAAGALIEDAVNPFGHFKCGIFFCAAVPLKLDLAKTGQFQSLSAAVDGVVIKVPTAHIWSNEGESHPGMGKDLALLCEPSLRSEYVHRLGHDVPGARSDDFLSGTVRVIERTIEMAR